MTAHILNADARRIPLADESAQCCVTSPPYYGLRDYGVNGQIGLEDTPEGYVANIVAVMREVWRVLRDDGVLWLNLGDSYWGGKGRSAHGGSEKQRERFERNESINRDYQEIGRFGWTAPKDGKHEVIKPKDLLGIPWRVAFALQDAGWYLRSDIIWAKPNPMPESVTDRPTKAHEYVFLLTKNARYFYDAEEVAEPATTQEGRPSGIVRDRVYGYDSKQAAMGRSRGGAETAEPTKRNLRSVWTIATQPYSGAHFATFPEQLPRRCILASTRAGDVVLDPFGGSGTTARVALALGRRAVCLELNPDYIALARKRVTVTLGLPI